MHTAGKSFPGCVLYGISGQTIAVTPVLHGLDKLTLEGNFKLSWERMREHSSALLYCLHVTTSMSYIYLLK